jgi:hypothetical protein
MRLMPEELGAASIQCIQTCEGALEAMKQRQLEK